MNGLRCLFLAFGLLCAAGSAASAQVPGLPGPPAASPAAPDDPLGRATPRGTILGFNLAVRSGDIASAAMYMQVTPAQRANVDALARDLNDLIDRYFNRPITSLSSSRTGMANDGLPLDRDRVQLSIEGRPYDILVVRVTDPQAGAIWQISSDSLAEVPILHQAAQAPWIERIMPRPLVTRTLFGVSLARLLGYAASLVLPLAAMWGLSVVFMQVAQRGMRNAARRRVVLLWYGGLRWLVVFILTLAIHLTLVRFLAFPLRFRYVYARLAFVAFVIAAAWLLLRVLTLSIAHARLMAQRRGGAGFSSLLMLIERVGKVIITLVAIFSILKLAGIDTSTALAGVGIGGVAVALGAQKSVENLLGGVFLITDKVLAVGDECRIADRVGRIEDITLRSVRLRTVDQTLLSIPAGVLSQASIENFSTRGKTPIQTMLRLRYETTATQLRIVLEGVRRLLASQTTIEKDSCRIRLVNFGAQAVELELFAYVLTADGADFFSVREELLLRIAEIVESSGSAFARPGEVARAGTRPAV